MQNIIDNVKNAASHVTISSGVLQVGAIVVLIFLLILIMARITRTYISWYTSGWYIWVILGFLFAVVIEGFFVVGGSTLFTAVLGWQHAPKPLQIVLDAGRSKLINVLGAQDEAPTVNSIVSDYNSLDSTTKEELKSKVCTPE